MSYIDIKTSSRSLITQSEIHSFEQPWHQEVLEDLKQRLGDPDFPCIFSRNAYKKEIVQFLFVEDLDSEGIQHLADGVQEYVNLSRDWNGRTDTAYPLIVAFSHTAVKAGTVEGYQRKGWRVLQALHDADREPWPDDVDMDPLSTNWSMCFDGMPLFCNMSNPAHESRRSRNLGRHFILVINPRERFDVFAGDTPRGRKTRENIRRRIDTYDKVPHASQLGSYGEGALEWWQYQLPDENTPIPTECPFRHKSS